MEQRERMLLEIAVAVVFITLLVLGSIVVINATSNTGGPKTETTITNSFNTYNYNLPAQTRYATPTAKPYIIDSGYMRVYHDYNDITYVKDGGRYSDNKRYLKYDSTSRLKVAEGLFGNDINRYEVYVRNREYTGGNFKVVFFFEDYYGDVNSESMIYYIPAREEKMFLIKDISPGRYDYRRWWYRVTPLTKTNSVYGN